MNTRFAPTVNGPLHTGHAYVALLNMHAAMDAGGEFIVRFDDDQEAWVEEIGRDGMAEFAKRAADDLAWLNITASRYTYESEERSRNDIALDALGEDSMLETGESLHFPHPYVLDMPAPYPYVPLLTASKAVADHRDGVGLLIRGTELLTEFSLYCYFCRRLGYEIPQFEYVPRLLCASGPYSLVRSELSDISKTAGNHRICDYRKKGWSSGSVLEMLAMACLVDPGGRWNTSNVQIAPTVRRVP